jgi:hypothetical protein
VDSVLTVKEIRERFPSEWVLIGDPQTSETLAVQAGKVLCHSKDRDEVYGKAIELRPKRCAFLYTGPIPAEGTETLL